MSLSRYHDTCIEMVNLLPYHQILRSTVVLRRRRAAHQKETQKMVCKGEKKKERGRINFSVKEYV